MDKVGQRFKCNEIYIPEVLIAARAMNASMEILKPELVKAGVKPIGKMLLGTVKGDLHDIGKNLVKMMAQGAGIEVVDMGIDVSADKFLQGLKDNPDAKAVGMSALLTTTMTGMKEVIDRFEKEGHAQEGEVPRGRRAPHRSVRQGDWCGRLRAGCGQRRGEVQGVPEGVVRPNKGTGQRPVPFLCACGSAGRLAVGRRRVVARFVSATHPLSVHLDLQRNVDVPELRRRG